MYADTTLPIQSAFRPKQTKMKGLASPHFVLICRLGFGACCSWLLLGVAANVTVAVMLWAAYPIVNGSSDRLGRTAEWLGRLALVTTNRACACSVRLRIFSGATSIDGESILDGMPMIFNDGLLIEITMR